MKAITPVKRTRHQPSKDRRLENLLGALSITIADRVRAALEGQLGAGGSAAAVLMMIGVEPQISAETIARQLGMAQPTVVQALGALKERGFVRQVSGEDRRVRELSLTSRGMEMVASMLEKRAAILGQLLQTLGRAERSVLTGAVEKMLIAAITRPEERFPICRFCSESECGPKDCPVEVAAGRCTEAGG